MEQQQQQQPQWKRVDNLQVKSAVDGKLTRFSLAFARMQTQQSQKYPVCSKPCKRPVWVLTCGARVTLPCVFGMKVIQYLSSPATHQFLMGQISTQHRRYYKMSNESFIFIAFVYRNKFPSIPGNNVDRQSGESSSSILANIIWYHKFVKLNCNGLKLDPPGCSWEGFFFALGNQDYPKGNFFFSFNLLWLALNSWTKCIL